MPSALRNQKGKEKKKTQQGNDSSSNIGDSSNSSSDEELQKLIYDYLIGEDMAGTAKSFLKDVGSDAKHFKSLDEPEESLDKVYATFQAAKQSLAAPPAAPAKKKTSKKTKSKGHDLLASVEGTGSELEGGGGAAASPKKKRKRTTPASSKKAKEGAGGDSAGTGAVSFNDSSGMKEETQKQYTFGWKRYTEYCELHSLNTLVGESTTPAVQILEFARYLMHNPGKTVKSSVANSYVSAVGKKLLDANVITAMKDIRTPELKELFSEAARVTQEAAAAAAAGTLTLETASATATSSLTEDTDGDSKKKSRV